MKALKFLSWCAILYGVLAQTSDAAARDNFVAGRAGEIGGGSRGSGDLVVYEASDGLVPVVIRGDPFAGQVANPNDIVAGVLRLPPGYPRASFIQTAEAENGRGSRLVVVFDAANPNLEVRRLCLDLDGVEVAAPVGQVRLSAAFCVGARVARGAVGSTPRPQAMNKEFKRFLARVLNEVFPIRRF